MQRLFSVFPTATPGYGLLLLRIVVAASLFIDAGGRLISSPNAALLVPLVALSGTIAVGFLTPVFSILCATVEVILLIANAQTWVPAALAGPLIAVVLSLLGPGAYSVDAYLFGRRVVVLHSTGSRKESDE